MKTTKLQLWVSKHCFETEKNAKGAKQCSLMYLLRQSVVNSRIQVSSCTSSSHTQTFRHFQESRLPGTDRRNLYVYIQNIVLQKGQDLLTKMVLTHIFTPSPHLNKAFGKFTG